MNHRRADHGRSRWGLSLAAVAVMSTACLIEPNPDFVESDTGTDDTGDDGECPEGTLDCDDQPGCESERSDPLTCGSCDKRCVVNGEAFACVDGECSGTITFTELADSYVDHDLPAQVFGGELELRVGDRRDAYIGLPSLDDIPSGATIEAVELRLSCSQAGGAVEVYRVSAPWDESSLAGNNAPIIIGDPLASFDAQLGENVIDVFGQLMGWRKGDPMHSLALRSKLIPPIQAGVTFASRESGEGPILVVKFRW